ncbi:hypothetical protein GCM10009850_057030 [Nonomuraea monospora]|uniref:Uncharacterized protein n=1 Tax=Nonomuraea monospora TaxID=568818 RepID=A0ABP5PF53_9ACTN
MSLEGVLAMRISRDARRAWRGAQSAIALCALMGSIGCDVQMFHTRLEVDPAVVKEVSAVGAVIARTTNELLYENTTQVYHLMIVDVGGTDLPFALDFVRERLRERGWTETDGGLVHVNMTSAKWDKTRLHAGRPSLNASFPEEQHLRIVKALTANANGSHAYVLIELSKDE